VNVTLVLTEEPHALVIPSRAIQTGQQGTYVFVIKADSTVEVRPITVERPLNGDSVISKGLVAGERVVTDGQLLLKPDAPVTIKPSLTGSAAPAKSEAPKP
jgi:multidrug efflux system membrane fusion protein